jgi:type I restriction enzyme S subunit
VRIRKTFLQEAIQGKLVPQDPNDEPASILLGRIKEEKLRLVKEGKLKNKDIVDSVIYKGDDNKYYEKKGKEIKCVDEEIPFDIPQSWEWSRLGYIIELKSGQDLTPDRYTSMEDGIPYITGASNFENKNIKLNRWTTTPTSIAYPGELLITCKDTVGAMAYNNTCTPFHIARQIMSIHSFIAEIGYIERYLEFSISTLEKAAHSIIPGISRETILQAIIPLPPLNEQKRILDSINTLFKCIK